MRVYGPVGADGVPILASMALYVDQVPLPAAHGARELAQALTFLHPSLTVLAPTVTRKQVGEETRQVPCAANVVKAISNDPNFALLQAWLETPEGRAWNAAEVLMDEDGTPLRKTDGTPWCKYVLAEDLR